MYKYVNMSSVSNYQPTVCQYTLIKESNNLLKESAVRYLLVISDYTAVASYLYGILIHICRTLIAG